nr:MAG TPA: hypothetical protein [Caudoviricetes sp.]
MLKTMDIPLAGMLVIRLSRKKITIVVGQPVTSFV